jgi:hypothetical protein
VERVTGPEIRVSMISEISTKMKEVTMQYRGIATNLEIILAVATLLADAHRGMPDSK